MNTFGRNFRVQILGESHGPKIGVLLDGVPAGIPLSVEDFMPDLARRKGGKPGTTTRVESDIPYLDSGIYQGHTTGTPLLITFANNNTHSASYDTVRAIPRPSQADWVADKRFAGFNDHRGSGHYSGRLTAGIVAAGVVAGRITGLKPHAQVISVGGSTNIPQTAAQALHNLDSVGGIVECTCHHIPVGLGSPFWDSTESLLAHAAFAIPGVRGVEFGAGFTAARMLGSEHNDRFASQNGETITNHAGGITGGHTNGNPLVWRAAVKPTASIKKAQHTLNMVTGEMTELKIQGRHDACIALRVPVIMEAITQIVLADLVLTAKAEAVQPTSASC